MHLAAGLSDMLLKISNRSLAGLYPYQLGELTVLPQILLRGDGRRGIGRERDRGRVGGEVE